jgi:hypothetical protein
MSDPDLDDDDVEFPLASTESVLFELRSSFVKTDATSPT